MFSQQNQRRIRWIAGWVTALAASLTAYSLGLPTLTAVSLSAVVPAVYIALSLCNSRILAYAVIMTALGAVWETGKYGKRDLFFGSGPNYADVLEELYPDRPEALMERALQVTACKMDPDRWNGAACVKLRSVSNDELFRLYDQAFEHGAAGNENQRYTHAVALILLKADQEKIDAAVAAWQKSFPASEAPDPYSWANPTRK